MEMREAYPRPPRVILYQAIRDVAVPGQVGITPLLADRFPCIEVQNHTTDRLSGVHHEKLMARCRKLLSCPRDVARKIRTGRETHGIAHENLVSIHAAPGNRTEAHAPIAYPLG